MGARSDTLMVVDDRGLVALAWRNCRWCERQGDRDAGTVHAKGVGAFEDLDTDLGVMCRVGVGGGEKIGGHETGETRPHDGHADPFGCG